MNKTSNLLMNLTLNTFPKCRALCVIVSTLVLTAIALPAFRPRSISAAQQSTSTKAIVRHGSTVDGRIEGSVQQLSGEDQPSMTAVP
jgi:hypothetical protein